MNENREYDPWPLEINVCENGKVLELSFDNDEKFLISAELLRVESPSAEVQGHGPNEKKNSSRKAGSCNFSRRTSLELRSKTSL